MEGDKEYWVIMCRKSGTGAVFLVADGGDGSKDDWDERAAVFESEDAAHEAASHTVCCKIWPYEIVRAP